MNDLLVRSNSRCEWFYLDGTRCQNTMSLKFHHRTYERFGHEYPQDFTVLCPVHHIIVDGARKRIVGQREDVIAERMIEIVKSKLNRLSPEAGEKFFSRLMREYKIYDDECAFVESRIDKIRGELEYLKQKADELHSDIVVRGRKDEFRAVAKVVRGILRIYLIASIKPLDDFADEYGIEHIKGLISVLDF